MGADLSRVRFDARHDHAEVLLQQGRVLLDADWNELVAVLDRRLRADAADLGSTGPAPGATGVAVVPATTPDAFKVSLTGGALTIGRGRMYVDGLVAESHGRGPLAFDPLLEGVGGTTDTAYADQPYLPDPPPLPTSGTHLAYLDVWRREVTHLEQPDLVEPALGVDTTARRQTVWQVKVHDPGGAAVTCATPDDEVPGWTALTAPSGARLSVDTIAVDDADDPCALPPTGGYRGLENQAYRVEVHTPGGPGTATFKWSRDNGSVAAVVVEVLTGGVGVRPASLGRDSVLRFADGDWVEVLDDHRELHGTPGEMRLAEVHEEDGTIRFTPALPADLVMSAADASARHLRIRRWDQKGQVRSGAGGVLDNLVAGSAGVITVPAALSTTVVLEHGLTVALGGSGFRTGDHWVFAARTADSSVEELTDAPPLGVHHHYARLGVLTFPTGATDCRRPWPPPCECDGEGCGDCTVCVTPESHASGALTIQAAVDDVTAGGGGTVCLEPGTYHLDDNGISVDRATSLRIRGAGPRTVVIAPGPGFQVTTSAFVTVEDLTVITRGQPAADVRGTIGVTLQRLLVLDVGNDAEPALRLDGVALATTVRDNIVVAPVGIGTGLEREQALLTAELRITDNLLVCRDLGVALAGGHLFSNAVWSNTVLRAGTVGIALPGALAPGHGFEVSDNTVHAGGTGIAVSPSGFTVDDNDVLGVPGERRAGFGVLVAPGRFSEFRGHTRISANRLRSLPAAGIGVLAATDALTVAGNLVEDCGAGLLMQGAGRAALADVSHNQVLRTGAPGSPALGIVVAGVDTAHLDHNTVHDLGASDPADGTSGILVVGCPVSRVSANDVDRVGPPDGGAPRSVGIAVLGAIDSTQVSGNTVRRHPVDVDRDPPSGFQPIVVGEGFRLPSGLGTTTLGDEASGVVLGTHGALAAAAVGGPAAVTLEGNVVSGNREIQAVVVAVEGDVVVHGNQVRTSAEGAPALLVRASSASVATNRLRGGNPSADLEVDPKRLAVVGNLTSSGITVGGAALGSPWSALNPDGLF